MPQGQKYGAFSNDQSHYSLVRNAVRQACYRLQHEKMFKNEFRNVA